MPHGERSERSGPRQVSDPSDHACRTLNGDQYGSEDGPAGDIGQLGEVRVAQCIAQQVPVSGDGEISERDVLLGPGGSDGHMMGHWPPGWPHV